MKDLELQKIYIQQAINFIKESVSNGSIPEEYQAVFLAGVEYGLDLRESEIINQ